MSERKTMSLSGFMGVDYSSSPMDVAKNRATNAKNFINENGINKKRNGWDEIFTFAPNTDGTSQRINGIWNFTTKGTDGVNYTFTIIHAGASIYSFTDNSALKVDSEETKISNGIVVADSRSYGIVYSSKLYILCGDYLVFGQFSDSGGKWELRRVFNNIDTHIPITAISIMHDGKTIENDQKAVVAYAYKANEKPNVLTTKRINKLYYEKSATLTNNIFTLDSKRIDNGEIKITLLEGVTETIFSGIVENNLELTLANKDKTITVAPQSGKITFNNILSIAPNGAQDNVTVEFCYLPRNEDNVLIENYEQRITKCKIGIMFGLGGVDDRLFIAGNAKFSNICFHSEIIADKGLTYFPDINTAACGNDGDPITAFSRLGDGTLAIHKQSGRNDSNIYFRRGATVTKRDNSGKDVTEEIFPLTAGAIGEGCITPYASANLSGDNLILSSNGVYGVVLGTNMVTNERYARERSRLINERLLKHNLSDACAIVYKNRYYLSVENECYIADARFNFSAKGDMPGAYNYEWWDWDNIPARVWANINDELYFGSETGSLLKFDSSYIDKTYEKISGGKISVDLANNGFNVNAGQLKKLTNGDRIKITSESGVYAEYILSGSLTTDNRIKVNDTSGVVLIEDTEIYAYEVSANSSITKKTPYVIKNIDYGNKTFELYKNGQKVSIVGRDFKFCIKLKNKEVEVCNIDSADGSAFFQVGIIYGKALKLIRPYTDEIEDMSVKIFYRRNVIAQWTTPVMDLGINTYSKNLHRISISSEPTVGGKIEFGYKTRTTKNIVTAQGVTTFSFDDIDFSDFSFELNSFATSYTKQLLVRNFNYIVLRFASTNDRAAAVNNIGLEYSIIKKNKGVK